MLCRDTASRKSLRAERIRLLVTSSNPSQFFPKRNRFSQCCQQMGLVRRKSHPLLNHPLWLIAGWTMRSGFQASLHRDFVQTDILHRGPDNGQTTGLGREDIDLIGALAHIALRDFQWRSSSEYAGASSQETHKRSTGAPQPQPGCELPRGSAAFIWL